MKRQELDRFLRSTGARPRKSLSQNFLIDETVIENILHLAEVQPKDTVLEIGPGPGALTKALLDKGADVFAVEIDPIFAKELSRFQNGHLTVFHHDFLKLTLPSSLKAPKIVANLPYHITTPILEKIFQAPFISITIMVQKELADRMIATHSSKTFGALTLFVQFYAEYQSSFEVLPDSFYPKPKVSSTVLRLNPKKPPDVDPTLFFQIVRSAFQKRRKMLTTSLPFDKKRIEDILIKLDIRKDARPENLSFEKWVALVKKLSDPLFT